MKPILNRNFCLKQTQRKFVYEMIMLLFRYAGLRYTIWNPCTFHICHLSKRFNYRLWHERYELIRLVGISKVFMMTSSNGNIFRVTGPLCGEFTGPGEFPTQRPVTRSFDVYFDLRPNKRLSKQSWGWWFETLSHPFWRHRNVLGSACSFKCQERVHGLLGP